jgi:hypothetical protein
VRLGGKWTPDCSLLDLPTYQQRHFGVEAAYRWVVVRGRGRIYLVNDEYSTPGQGVSWGDFQAVAWSAGPRGTQCTKPLQGGPHECWATTPCW